MVVVYAVTGLLYLAGTDENFTSTVTVHELDGTDRPPYEASLRELERRGATLPEGKVRPFKGITCWVRWTNDHVLFIRKGTRSARRWCLRACIPSCCWCIRGRPDGGLLSWDGAPPFPCWRLM